MVAKNRYKYSLKMMKVTQVYNLLEIHDQTKNIANIIEW